MASLIPILQDIIPMLRPGKVQVVKSTELDEGTGQTEGMVRKGAIVGMSDHLCASVMIAKPHTCSAVHHHGEQDTIIYAASGHGTIITNPSLAPPPTTSTPAAADPSSIPSSPSIHPHLKKTLLSPGDFAIIPAWTEHQEVNESDEDTVWIITRSGRVPVVVNLQGWGGREI